MLPYFFILFLFLYEYYTINVCLYRDLHVKKEGGMCEEKKGVINTFTKTVNIFLGTYSFS